MLPAPEQETIYAQQIKNMTQKKYKMYLSPLLVGSVCFTKEIDNTSTEAHKQNDVHLNDMVWCIYTHTDLPQNTHISMHLLNSNPCICMYLTIIHVHKTLFTFRADITAVT